MPRSIVVIPTTTNLIYDAEHQALDPVELADVTNQDKYLRNTAGSLEWRSKNVANGLVELNSLGLVDNTLLPSYVDDVLTYATIASFPVTGETGKIYVDESNGYSYRWTGSTYYNISTQSFYTKTQLDSLLNAKVNLSGGTMSGNLAMGNNNISGVGTLTTTNLAGCTLTGTLTTGAQSIYGVTGAVDVLNLKATNLRSRDDVISATMETGGTFTLQQNMNANSKNISSVATLGATTVNTSNLSGCTLSGNVAMGTNNISGIGTASGTTATFTNVNPTNLGGCTMTGTLNMGVNQISSSGSITTSGVIQGANIQCDGYFARTAPSALHFQLIDTDIRLSKSLVFRPDLTETDRTISNLITLNATNVNVTNLSGCNTTGNILLGSNTYIWGPSNNNTIHVQNLKGDNLISGANTTVATIGSGGIQLSLPLNANNQNILDGGRIEFASLAGGDGTVIATSTSNFLTMSRAINMNSQNMDNLAMLNGVTYKAMRKYTQSTTSNGSGNTVMSFAPDSGFSIVSVVVTADLVCRNMQYISMSPTYCDYSENVGGGKAMVMTIMCMQD